MSTTATALAQKKQPPQRPNIVLILADDLAAWMVGRYGNQEIRTPNLDLLARGGTRFIRNSVVTPAGSPSRATLFTGRVPRQHGIQDFLTDQPLDDPPQGQAAPPPSFEQEVMISDILAASGYHCGCAGKWHMGDDRTPRHGYRFWYTMPGASSPYQNPRMSRNGETIEEQGYLADLITSKSVQFLEDQRADRPFFLVASYLNPHPPYEGHPQKYYDLYAKTAFETIERERPAPNALREKEYLKDIVRNLRMCAAAVTALDDQIPALISALDRKGLRDNTIVIFTSPNGYLLGRHGLWSNGHASRPINMYAEVMETPMIWNWPGKIPVEGARPELVSCTDFLPTVCDFAGAPVPEGRNLSGRSYLPLLLNRPLPKKAPWRNLVFGHLRNTEMARDKSHKLILRDGGEGPGELYDLRTDLREKVNQYDNDQYITVRNELTRALEAWRKKYA